MRLRDYRDKDRAALRRLFGRYVSELMSNAGGPWPPSSDPDWWRDSDDVRIAVATREAELTGFVMAATGHWVDDDIVWELSELYVAKPHRGQGIGRALVSHGLGLMRGRCGLQVLARDLAAERFWDATLRAHGLACHKSAASGTMLPLVKYRFELPG